MASSKWLFKISLKTTYYLPQEVEMFHESIGIHLASSKDQFFPLFPTQKFVAQGGDLMKRIAVQLFIITATVMVYVVPALAGIGGW